MIGGQCHTLATLPLGKEIPYPFVQEAIFVAVAMKSQKMAPIQPYHLCFFL